MNDNDELTTVLKCDVELIITGPLLELVNKRAAAVLRALADRIEKDEFEDGFFPVKDENGDEVGEIYVDYSGMM